MRNIELLEYPRLREPFMVAGFYGRLNVEDLSAGPLNYLIERLRPKKLGEITSPDFYTLQIPYSATFNNGYIENMKGPHTHLFFLKDEKKQDLMFVVGPEPDLKREEYANTIAKLAKEFNVKRLYTVGGTYAGVPHTRGPVIAGLVNNRSLIPLLNSNNIERINYKGPVNIFNHVLLHQAAKEKLDGIGLWAYVPCYITPVPNSQKYHHALLKKLTGMLGLELSLDDIRGDEAVDEQISAIVQSDPQLSQLVKNLEETYDLNKTWGGVKIDFGSQQSQQN